jgi:hypothetical protein
MAEFVIALTIVNIMLLVGYAVDGRNDLIFEVGGDRDTDAVDGMLQPQESESRYIQYLDGMWDFRADNSPSRSQGLDERWYSKRLSKVCHGWNIP